MCEDCQSRYSQYDPVKCVCDACGNDINEGDEHVYVNGNRVCGSCIRSLDGYSLLYVLNIELLTRLEVPGE